MQLENQFTVAAPVDEAWKVLLDVDRVARCMPGATLDAVHGDEFEGRVKVKVGPIVVTYQGSARFVEKDEAQHRAVIDASGKESRGSGTAKAMVTTALTARGEHTDVHVLTDLNITGRPAQFGRGVIADVAGKLTGQFAASLAEELEGSPGPGTVGGTDGGAVTDGAGASLDASASDGPGPASAAGTRVSDTGTGTARAGGSDDAIDLLGISTAPILKRLLPLAGVAGLVGVVLALLRRRGRD